jgi:hypothetical protein
MSYYGNVTSIIYIIITTTGDTSNILIIIKNKTNTKKE